MTDHKPKYRQDVQPRQSVRRTKSVSVDRPVSKPRTQRSFTRIPKSAVSDLSGQANKRFMRIVRWWKKQDTQYHWKWRAANVLAAVLILSSVITPVILELQSNKGYELSSATLGLVGKTDPKLSSKLTYDAKTKTYQFNKESIKEFNPVDQLKAQVGQPGQSKENKALYSLDVPQDMSKGTTYYDTNSQLSFTLVPQFDGRSGKLQQQRLVYPLADHAQAVYTLKNNGLKEDIVVQKSTKSTMRFSYTLQLPKTLEARVLDDGSGAIGIYSANPSLFGNISYGSDADREKVEKARENGAKDTLVFGIPAPTITASKGDDSTKAKARFELKGQQLTVVAEGLTSLKQPFSIDPSVVITSTSDFSTNGNNEGNITFGTNAINRGTLTGGTVSSWTTDADTFTPARQQHNTVATNGYLYIMAGESSTSALASTTVQYAPIISDGSIGAWGNTSSFTTARQGSMGVAYNGYVYIMGGCDDPQCNSVNGGTLLNDVQYAKVQSNGTLGSFVTDGGTSFTTPRTSAGAIAYNGYMYIIGGCTARVTFATLRCGGGNTTDTQYALINPDGSIGTWNTTNAFTTGRRLAGVAVYNGYMYIMGGENPSNATLADTQYAPINANGTLGTWLTTSSLAAGRLAAVGYAAGGYLYLVGGAASNCGTTTDTTQYATINANGSIGTWQTTTVLNYHTGCSSGATYNGYLYLPGGNNDGTMVNTTQYATIDSAGALWAQTSTTSFDTAANGRSMPAVVATNGYLYVLGGFLETGAAAATNTGKFAAINSDGTVGSWSATNVFSEARSGATAIVNGGYLYLVGGFNQSGTANCPDLGTGVDYCKNIEWASINASTGALTWQGTTYTYSTTGREAPGAATINGYLYVVGGTYSNNGLDSTEVNYARICDGVITTNGCNGLPNGALGTFAPTTTALPTTKGMHTGVAYTWSGKLYAVGSRATTYIHYATPDSDGNITTSWTQTSNDLNAGANRQNYSVTMNKGIFYLSGGFKIGGLQGDMYKAGIQSDGTVSSWSLLPQTLTTDMYLHTMATYNDNLYMVGGDINSVIHNQQETVYFYPINYGGNGSTAAWASAGTGFTNARFDHYTVAYNGFLYVAGGVCGVSSCNNDTQYAPINSNGTIGAWGTDTDANANGQGIAGMLAYKGYMYINTDAAPNHSVQYALICTGSNNGVDGCGASAGPLGNWHLTTDYAAGQRSYVGFAVYNDYLYILGGYNGSTYSSDVLYAPINSNGTIGSWTTQSGGLYAAINNFLAIQYVITNGYLYIIDGGTTGQVHSAPVNSNGSIGSWALTTSLPFTGVGQSYAYVANGYLYFLIGGSDGVYRNKVLYAAMGANGTLGPWVTSTNTFSTGRTLHSGAFYNGNLYITGGCTGNFGTLCTGTLNDIQYAGQNAIPRKGLYSKLLTFSYNTSLRQITYNGSLANGVLDINYKGSSSGTSWTGSVTNASSLTNLRCPAPASNRYLQLMATLDDTYRATFPDYSTDASNLTDLTLSYEFARPPNIRLKLGKILQENLGQSDLDICKLNT